MRRASHADSEVGLDPRALVEHACVNGLAHRSVDLVAENPVGGSLGIKERKRKKMFLKKALRTLSFLYKNVYLSVGSLEPKLPKVRHIEKGSSVARGQTFGPNLENTKIVRV